MYWCYVYMIYKKVIIIASMTPQTDTSIWKCVRKYNSEFYYTILGFHLVHCSSNMSLLTLLILYISLLTFMY